MSRPPRKPFDASRPAPRRGPPRRPARSGPPRVLEHAVIYGFHPVVEALRNPRRKIRRLLATENGLNRLVEAGIPVPAAHEVVRPSVIDAELTPDALHQGLLVEADPLAPLDLDGLADDAIVVALDQITDPHNVGAIVRTCAAFRIDAILTTERHSPLATGVLAKSASGGLEHVPLVVVKNLGEAMTELGARGFLRVGLDSEGPEPLDALPLRRPLLLALGAEGKGLRQKTRSLCDHLARLELPGAIISLNVSNAAAIALHIAARAAPRR